MSKKFQAEERSRTWQEQKINGAAHAGELHRLFWMVEMRYPGTETWAAAYPGRLVPVVPLVPDRYAAREYAHLMLEIFRWCSPPYAAFSLAVVPLEALQLVPWYIWGDEPGIDRVCPSCAAVGDDCVCAPQLEYLVCTESGIDLLRFGKYASGCQPATIRWAVHLH